MQRSGDTNTSASGSPGQIERGLSSLSRRAGEGAAAYRFALYAAIVLPPGLLIFPSVEHADYGYFAVACYCSLTLLLVAVLYDRLLRRALRRELSSCDIYLRLAIDGLDHDPIFERMPWPWQRLLPRNRAGSLQPTLQRIASNLDFYLGASRGALLGRRLQLSLNCLLLLLLSLDLYWLLWTALPLLQQMLANKGWVFSTPYSSNSTSAGIHGLMLGLRLGLLWIVLLLGVIFQVYRRQVWTEEFVEYMRAHLRG